KADEIAGYIRTRLKVAGTTRLDIFKADAIALIYRASEGIPRLVNNICDNALLTGFATNKKMITAEIISEVTASLDLLQPMIADEPQAIMVDSLPPMPVMRESEEESWIADARPHRRRHHRKRNQPRSGRRQGTLLQPEKMGSEPSQFNSQFKVLTPIVDETDDHEDDIGENVKAS